MPVRKLQSYEVDYQELKSSDSPYQDYTPEAQSGCQSQVKSYFLLICCFFVSVGLLVLSF